MLASRVAKVVYLLGTAARRTGRLATGLRADRRHHRRPAHRGPPHRRRADARARPAGDRLARRSAPSSKRSMAARTSSRRPRAPSGTRTSRPTARTCGRTRAGWRSGETELLREAFAEFERGLKPRQGESLVRKAKATFGPEQPSIGEPGEVPIWVRDELVRRPGTRSARTRSALGTDSPLVLVWIPKEQADALQGRDGRGAGRQGEPWTSCRAGDRGRPQCPRRASSPAVTTRGPAERPSPSGSCAAARVFQGGGNEVEAEPQASGLLGPRWSGPWTTPSLRLFPDFGPARQYAWDDGASSAPRTGPRTPLAPLGHRGEVDEHPVRQGDPRLPRCRRQARHGRPQAFEAPPYGWPRTRSTARSSH